MSKPNPRMLIRALRLTAEDQAAPRFAIVPREPTEEMRLAAWLVTGADPIATDEQMSAVLAGAIEAAPPPPEQVLSDEEIQAMWNEACKDSPSAPGWNRHIRFARAIERAVLHNLGAKNGE